MGIVHEPRPSLLMQNDEYTQARSATKRSSRISRQYDGEIEDRPSMIHLQNLNPVTNESIVEGVFSKFDASSNQNLHY